MLNEIMIFAAYVVAFFTIVLCFRVFLIPVRIAGRLITSIIAGAGLLALANIAGSIISIAIPLNPVNSVIAGILGLPGVALLAALLN